MIDPTERAKPVEVDPPDPRAEPDQLNVFDLYEMCVQAPELEARFLRSLHGANGTVLGEDFAGPAGVSRAWLTLNPAHSAVASDFDPLPLEHAQYRLKHTLPGALPRFNTRTNDVLETGDRVDIIASFNFAACELLTRDKLVTYFRHALFRLNANGVLALDTYTGPDAMVPGVSTQSVETHFGLVEYQWRQVSADIATGRVVNAIDFTLPDARRFKDAFVYDWRLWTVPELRDAMREAGFRSTEVHDAYGGALDGDGNPVLNAVSDDRSPEAVWECEEDGPSVLYVVGRV